MLSVNDIHISFGEFDLLRGVSFQIQKGERVSIIGPGGCGKSVLLKLILGLLEPTAGNCLIAGVDMHQASEEQKRQVLKRVGVAFQQGALFDYMNVHQNIRFALNHMTQMDEQSKNEVIRQLLEGVKLAKAEWLMPYELSGGMQRRVGVARALAVAPQIAIFDEPTSGLDPVTSTIILNMIKELSQNSNETTAIVTTSNVEIAMRFSERMIIIHDGVIVADGSWQDLLLHADDWVRHFLSVRLIGLDKEYALGLNLPKEFLKRHWA